MEFYFDLTNAYALVFNKEEFLIMKNPRNVCCDVEVYIYIKADLVISFLKQDRVQSGLGVVIKTERSDIVAGNAGWWQWSCW